MKLASVPEGKILVALSGGADSTALLFALTEKIGKERVCAFHLNHCLRGAESDGDEEFCRSLCGRIGVKFASARRDILSEKMQGETVEQAARRVRYAELCAAAKFMGCAAIATAHTADDNAETVLMNLARGSGGSGFCGIPPTRELGAVTVIRPMLTVTRAEVEDYLTGMGQAWRTDSSNLTDDYSRNILRHHAIPALRRVNSRAVEHIASAAELARQDEEYLSGEAAWLVERAGLGENRYDAELLADAARPIASRALRQIFGAVSHRTPERVHVEALLRLCADENPSAQTALPGGVTARREYGELVFETRRESDDPGEIPLKIGGNLFGGYTVFAEECVAPKGLRAAAFDLENPIYLRADRRYVLRTRREGDSLRPKGRGVTKSLKKLCVELKIPAAERSRLPVVFDSEGGCGAFLGYAPDEDCAAAGGEPAVKVWAVKI